MQQSYMRAAQPASRSGPRWMILRFISVILKIFAFLALLSGLGFGVFGIIGISAHAIGVRPLPDGIEYAPIPFTIVSFTGGIFAFIMFYVFADFIMLLIAIEKNTRN